MEEVLLARSWKGLLGDHGTDVLLHENSRAGNGLTTVGTCGKTLGQELIL